MHFWDLSTGVADLMKEGCFHNFPSLDAQHFCCSIMFFVYKYIISFFMIYFYLHILYFLNLFIMNSYQIFPNLRNIIFPFVAHVRILMWIDYFLFLTGKLYL